MPDTMTAPLSARIEAGPASRELDAEIARALGLEVKEFHNWTAVRESNDQPWKSCPCYTTSVDAALTTVPPECTNIGVSWSDGYWRASIIVGGKTFFGDVEGAVTDLSAAARAICATRMARGL